MRFTIDVPKALCQRLEAKAARERRSIEEVAARIVVSNARLATHGGRLRSIDHHL